MMSQRNDNYSLLIQKLDEFIRKYYVNKLLRGIIFSLSIVLALFLAMNIAEYYLYMSSTSRTVIFFGFMGISLASLIYWVGIPLLHFFRLGKVISHDQAAQIIGTHFTNVQDRLLNVLQLKKLAEQSNNTELINASIDQKIENLKPVPFSSAIKLKENKQYTKYLAPPALLLLVLLLASPNILKDGSKRMFYHNVHFERQAPFQFEIANENLKALQNQDLTLNVNVSGRALPQEIMIVMDDQTYRLNRNDKTSFSYEFSNLQKDIDFHLQAGKFRSSAHTINVLPKPAITSFDVFLDYPAYTGKKKEKLKNTGDLVLPEGTKAKWVFNAKNTKDIDISFPDSTYTSEQNADNKFVFQKQLLEDKEYKLKVSNQHIHHADSISYSVNVIPDLFPTIEVEEVKDSLNEKYVYYLGDVSDDHGITSIYFKYRVIPKDTTGTPPYKKTRINADYEGKSTSFEHLVNVYDYNLQAGDKLSYYFEVWDNDGINGSKSARTQIFTYNKPTEEEYKKLTEKSNEEIKEELSSAAKEAQELKKETKKIQDKILKKKDMSWEDKKALEETLKKQQQLEKDIQSLQKQYEKNLEQQSEYKKSSESVSKKQQQLKDLFDKVMDKETKDLFKKMESMMEKMNEMNKEKSLEELQEMELTNEQLEKEMDRMLSLFKQLEFEQKMQETLDELNELSKQEEKLSEKSKQQDNNKSEEIAKEQQKLNDEFEEIKKDMEDLKKKSEEIGRNSQEFNKTDQQQQEISQEMKEAMEQLQKNNSNKASGKQKNASDKMKEMSQQMASMMQSMQMKQMQEDMEALRQLLENLIHVSVDQENLLEEVKRISVNSPKYKKLVQEQYKLKDDAKMVEDSLYALSKRIFQIKSFVNKEIKEINYNMEKGINKLEKRKTGQATTNQQYVMTGMNNLALMLSDVMQSMQQQMASQMQGSQMCQKSGGKKGKMGLPKLSQMQKQLNKQIQQMKEQMKKGQKPGQKGDGKKGKKSGGKNGMSKELAKMARKQAAIRKAIQELNKQEDQTGKNSLGDLDKLEDEMEKTEEDLVNKQLNEKMLERQQEITTRLLEAEDAMRKRKTKKEREAKTAQEQEKKMPPSLEEYLKKREAEIELYKTLPPKLKPYYKFLVEKYFKSISF